MTAKLIKISIVLSLWIAFNCYWLASIDNLPTAIFLMNIISTIHGLEIENGDLNLGFELNLKGQS